MKRSLLAAGLVGLAITGLWYFAGGAQPLPVASAADDSPRVAAPYTHENLAVYFVYGSDSMPDAKVLSLQEALERNLAVVHETSNVNMLAVENLSSEYELFVQSGDIVKGGKQDRMVQLDMLLPPKSGAVAMPANCVEQGRWTGRGSEDSKRFASSYKCAAGKELKYANATGQQPAVWQNVTLNQAKLSANVQAAVTAEASPTSFQLTLESPVIQAKVAEYETALKAAGENREGVVGVVFVVNGQVTGAEVYGSCALFRKAWPKLLNSAAVEAVADRTDAPTATPPTAREVERYLAYGATAEPKGAADELLPAAPPYERIRAAGRGDARELFIEAIANADGVATPVVTAGAVFIDSTPQPNRVDPQTPVRVHAGFSNLPARAANPPGTPERMGMDFSSPREAPPANTNGNRLNSNRTENRSTLMVESRDPARANAVIHRSYIKK